MLCLGHLDPGPIAHDLRNLRRNGGGSTGQRRVFRRGRLEQRSLTLAADPHRSFRFELAPDAGLTPQTLGLRRAWLATLVADIAARHAAGEQLVIVSSGAIALGARKLALPKGGRASLEDAQAAAATGQAEARRVVGAVPDRSNRTRSRLPAGTLPKKTDKKADAALMAAEAAAAKAARPA